MKRKRKKSESHDNEERWLLTYADMITLLMVFFIVMYSIAEVKANKLKSISFALNQTFQTEETANKESAGKISIPKAQVITNKKIDNKDEIKKEDKTEKKDEVPSFLNKIGKILKTNLKKEKIKDAVNLEIKKNELIISLNTGNGFFDKGSADISPPTEKVLNVISEVCKDLPDEAFIKVEGYTCNLPITSGNFPSNWELSTARATNVAKYLIEKGKLDPRQFSAAGYGEYNPKFPNTSEENRAKNRRVDITISFIKTTDIY